MMAFFVADLPRFLFVEPAVLVIRGGGVVDSEKVFGGKMPHEQKNMLAKYNNQH